MLTAKNPLCSTPPLQEEECTPTQQENTKVVHFVEMHKCTRNCDTRYVASVKERAQESMAVQN